MFLSKQGRSLSPWIIAASMCWSVSAMSAGTQSMAASAAHETNNESVDSILSASSLPPNFSGDDPEHVRDALDGHPVPGRPSITSRVRTFLSHPFKATKGASQAAGQSSAQRDQTFIFVIPVTYGVRYQSKRKMLTVNVSLAAPENPDAILLKQTVKGQSGRKLVVAPEAKAKGFVQTFDLIQLDPEGSNKATVRGSTLLPTFDRAHGNGDFAIVLVCTLEPPFLTDDVEHTAPSDEEPTDITRRTSTLNGRIAEAWLIDRKDGTIITKRLSLVK